jgi:hypothetical protein
MPGQQLEDLDAAFEETAHAGDAIPIDRYFPEWKDFPNC